MEKYALIQNIVKDNQMNSIYKLERKFGKYAIPNLYLIVIVCLVTGYVIYFLAPGLYSYLILSPYLIVVKHEYWRLFTWIFTVPYPISGAVSLIFLPVNMFFYYFLGKSLENYWGRFMYNLYVIGGALLIDVLVLLGGLIYFNIIPGSIDTAAMSDAVFAGTNVTYYMLISIFLAFTVVGGNHTVYLYFLIPIKMKWLGYMDLIFLAYYFVTGGVFTKLIVFGSVANYFIYYFINRNRTRPSLADRKRQREFDKAVKRGQAARVKRREPAAGDDNVIRFPGAAIHMCAVCGRTELDNPNLEFRFCSKCNGNFEYCSDHLYTHDHKA